MAWITVHDQIFGRKLRRLEKAIGCSQNEALGMLVRLWLWGISNAESDGRILSSDKKEIAQVLSYGIHEDIDPADAVEAMVETGWLDIEDVVIIHDWEEWQEQWYSVIEARKKAIERKKKEREQKKAVSAVPQALVLDKREQSNTSSPQEETEEAEAVTASTSAYTMDFEKFWSAYPRKIGKSEAYKKYRARLNDGFRESDLLGAAEEYARRCKKDRTEEKYIKHAKTFLSENTPFTDFMNGKVTDTKERSQAEEEDPFGEWRR